jgi:hypothetical protein
MNNSTPIKKLLTLIIGQFLLLCPHAGQAQTADKIYKKDSSILSAKIVKITADSIFYKAYWEGKSTQVVFQMIKSEVYRLVIHDAFGVTYEITEGKAVKKSAPYLTKAKFDKVYKTDGTILSARIVDMARDTIKYQAYWDKKSPIFTLLKSDVEAIDFKNGTTEYYTQAAVNKLLVSFGEQKLLDKNSHSLISEQRNVGLNINLGGAGFLASVNVDAFLSRNFSLELGIPLGLKGIYGGGKIHFPMQDKNGGFNSLYVGCLGTIALFPDSEGLAGLYLPLGFHSTAKGGLIFSVEIAAIRTDYGFLDRPWGQIRFGYRF